MLITVIVLLNSYERASHHLDFFLASLLREEQPMTTFAYPIHCPEIFTGNKGANYHTNCNKDRTLIVCMLKIEKMCFESERDSTFADS